MGISLYLIWNKGLSTPWAKPSFTAFAIQLVINTSWNIFFFGMQSLFYGLVVILIMWVAIAATIALFAKVSKPAALLLLLLPYIIWVTIATTLSCTLWTLNP